MKIKFDFVTNSSSSCYILAIPKDQLNDVERIIEEMCEMEDASNEGVGVMNVFKTIKELNEYTHDGPFDWVSKCTGPKFVNFSEKQYKLYRKNLTKDTIIVQVSVDNNIAEHFEATFDTIIHNYC